MQNVLANYDRAYSRASLKYGGHMRDAKVQATLGLYGDPFRTPSNGTTQTITTQEDTDDEDYYECANASEMGILTLEVDPMDKYGCTYGFGPAPFEAGFDEEWRAGDGPSLP